MPPGCVSWLDLLICETQGYTTSTCYSALDWVFLIQPHSDGLEGHRGKEGGVWGIIPKRDLFLIYP